MYVYFMSVFVHEDMDLLTVKHTPVVTKVHNYCNISAPEPKGEMDPSTVKHIQ